MLFNSLHFLVFFPIVTALFFLLPQKFRWAMLLAASCYFYMVFKPVYILILCITIAVDYVSGIYIEKSEGKRRKYFMIASIVTNVAMLAFFKYYNFLNYTWQDLVGISGLDLPVPPFLAILLPIGLSFHTFQSLSYVVEVYRKKYPAERHLGIFALYVMFYPQLVAGPIERPQNVLWQFKERHYFVYERVKLGLQLMMWGMFKKVVIADRCAAFANEVYNQPHDYTGIPLIIGTVFFAFQIFCDFSGYSDIALGSAQVMGFKLMQNFDRPYFAKSISEFWKRWHISLSTWFRDYLYISLGGSRVSKPRQYFNLLFTFLVSGLWHGANWTYVIWGGLNGLYLIAEMQWQGFITSLRDRSKSSLSKFALNVSLILLTFGLTCLAWIFFRANTVSDAFYIVSHLFSGIGSWPQNLVNPTFLKLNVMLGKDKFDFIVANLAIVFLLITHYLQRGRSGRTLLNSQNTAVRWAFYFAIVFSILFLGAFNESQQFIYFQF